MALIYDAHLKQKELSLDVCLTALSDTDVGEVGGLALQNRAQKLLSKSDKQFQAKIELIEPEKVIIFDFNNLKLTNNINLGVY